MKNAEGWHAEGVTEEVVPVSQAHLPQRVLLLHPGQPEPVRFFEQPPHFLPRLNSPREDIRSRDVRPCHPFLTR